MGHARAAVHGLGRLVLLLQGAGPAVGPARRRRPAERTRLPDGLAVLRLRQLLRPPLFLDGPPEASRWPDHGGGPDHAPPRRRRRPLLDPVAARSIDLGRPA